MSKPLVVTIPHRLGKDEAVRRLKSGLGNARTNFAHLFTVQEETWTGDHLAFRVSALGQVVSGGIDVLDDQVTCKSFCLGSWRRSPQRSSRSFARKAR